MIAIDFYLGTGVTRIKSDFDSVGKALLQEPPRCLVKCAPQEEPSNPVGIFRQSCVEVIDKPPVRMNTDCFVMDGHVKRLGALQESCGSTLEIGSGRVADLYEAPESFHSNGALAPVVAYVTEGYPQKGSWHQVTLLRRTPV